MVGQLTPGTWTIHLGRGPGCPGLCADPGATEPRSTFSMLSVWRARAWLVWAEGSIYACHLCDELSGTAMSYSPVWADDWNGWSPERLECRGATARWAS